MQSCLGVLVHGEKRPSGTLDLLVLKTLSQTGKLHGYGIVVHIQRASDELLSVEEGSLYPALHRMEQSGWIASEWALTETPAKQVLPAFPGRPKAFAGSGKEFRTPGQRRPCNPALCVRRECHVFNAPCIEPVFPRQS